MGMIIDSLFCGIVRLCDAEEVADRCFKLCIVRSVDINWNVLF